MYVENKEREVVITAKTKLLDLNLAELWHYRDLILLFVKRNYSTRYKQTILGPLWLILNPLISTALYIVIFTSVAHLPTDNIDALAFYLSGSIIWSLFSACLNQTSGTFLANAGIMGKVYFPRLVMPISTVITSMLDFLIQFGLLIVLAFVQVIRGEHYSPNAYVALIPALIIQLTILGLGFGIIISSLTTKYRDLTILVGFGLRLWMYLCPVVYSASMIPDRFINLYMLNPVTPALMIFRYAIYGSGYAPVKMWGVSWIVTLVVLIIGVIIFNKVEKTFMDTV